MTETRRAFGKRIMAMRLQQKLTQEDLARAAGLSARTIFNVEKGIYSVTIDTVQKVAQALGVHPRSLFKV